MTIYRRLLLLSLVFVCLFVLFLPTCYATEVDENAYDDFIINESVMMKSSGIDTDSGLYKISYRIGRTNTSYDLQATYKTATVTPSNQQNFSAETDFYVRETKNQVNPYSSSYRMVDRYTIARRDGEPILKAGQSVDVKLTNIVSMSYGKTSSGDVYRTSGFTESAIEHVELWLADESGDYRVFNDNYSTDVAVQSSLGNGFDLSYTFDSVEEDTYFLTINIFYQGDKAFKDQASASAGSSSGWDWYYITREAGFDTSSLSLNFDDNTSGLLSNIIELINNLKDGVSNIWDTVVNGFSSVVSSIGSVVSKIAELPSLIWDFIENGLQILFVPDSEFIEEYKNEYNALLANRFGAIYQSCDILVDYFRNILSDNRVEDSIYIPGVTVNLAGVDYTFGDWDVRIVPERFNFLVDFVKFAIDVVCSFLFINGLRRRYDNLMGGV